MKRYLPLAMLGLLIGIFSVVKAQEETQSSADATSAAHESVRTPATANIDRGNQEEEMQVLAAIVHENMQLVYHTAEQNEAAAILPPLVEHLEGYGMVLQMRLPPAVAGKQVGTEPAPAISRWEATRQRLRGNSSVAEQLWNQKCQQCHVAASMESEMRSAWTRAAQQWMRHVQDYSDAWPQQSEVVDAAVDALLENGQHLHSLSPLHRVTISLSFAPQDRRPTATILQQENAAATEFAPDESADADPNQSAGGEYQANSQLRHFSSEQFPSDLGDFRRWHLDITGTLPDVDTVRAFERGELQESYRRLSQRLMHSRYTWHHPAESPWMTALLESPESSTRVRISVRKVDLDEAASGQISRDELRRRTEIKYSAQP